VANNIQVSLSPDRVALAPGDTAEFSLVIHNTSDVVEEYSIEVQGISSSWSSLSASTVSLLPGEKESVLVNVNPPISAASQTGSYEASVKVASKRDATMFTSASFVLDLSTATEWEIKLSPRQATGKEPFHVIITNRGNVRNTYRLGAADREGMCDYRFASDTVVVGAGATSEVTLTVSPKRKPSRGESKRVSFSVTATSLNGATKTMDGEVEFRAGAGCLLALAAMPVALLKILIPS
jgi:uncharacterized membrane protein